MNLRRIFFHGFLYIEHERVWLIFHGNGTQCLGSGCFVLCDYRCDIIPVKTHVFCQHQAVCHVLVVRVG